MATRVRNLSPRDGGVYRGYDGTSILDRFPVSHPSALQDFFRTRAVLIKGDVVTTPPTYSMNDMKNMLRGLLRDPSTVNTAVADRELVTFDFVNNRTITTPTATGGLYTTSTNAAGTFVPVGDHSENTASPSLLSFATAAGYVTGIAVMGLFVVETNDTDGVVGVYLKGTAATDHYRIEINVSEGDFQTVSRAASTDTTDLEDTDETAAIPATTRSFVSLGMRYNADHTVIGVLNGDIVLSGTASAGAQALTGNAVGVRQTGAAPGTGPLLFNATDI